MVIVAAVWTPDPLTLPAGATVQDLQHVVDRFRQAAFDAPLLSTARLLSYYSVLWPSVMLATAWKVVSRVRLGPTLAVGAFLLLLLGGMAGLASS
jgi:hypothetical protein